MGRDGLRQFHGAPVSTRGPRLLRPRAAVAATRRVWSGSIPANPFLAPANWLVPFSNLGAVAQLAECCMACKRPGGSNPPSSTSRPANFLYDAIIRENALR